MLQAFRFDADKEYLRQPRVIRVGLIQNSIAIPTTSHFADQKKAIMEKVKPMIDAAGDAGVNILCLQVSQLSVCTTSFWHLMNYSRVPMQLVSMYIFISNLMCFSEYLFSMLIVNI